MSEQPQDQRREFLEKLKYMLGEERWLKFLEMAESGELDKKWQHFREMLDRDELEQFVKQFEFKREFPGTFN
ncbi:MAG: hypothetical protein WA876_11360 [Candidatus Acidiferrales bacterium]